MAVCVVRAPVTRAELEAIAAAQFGDMVKAVVDVRRRIMEFDSVINIRPSQGNRSRDVDDDAPPDSVGGLSRYCLQFGVLARRRRS
jgi:hypothetical protein